jgi:K+-sensing histidine kinase KdpD
MDAMGFVERHRAPVLVTAVVLPLLVCAVLARFRDSVTTATAVLLLVLVVVAAASTGSRVAGIAAALSSGLWFDLLLTQPYGRLAIDDRNDVEAAVLLVLIGAAVTEVALWGHRQQARSAQRSGYLDGVLGTAEIVTLRRETPEALVQHVAHQVQELLDVTECRYVVGPVRDPRTAILDHSGLVSRHGHPVDVDRDGLPTDSETALVLTQGTVTTGHFLLTSASDIARPTLERRRVAVLLADQLGPLAANPHGHGPTAGAG